MTDPARRPRYSFREYVLLEEHSIVLVEVSSPGSETYDRGEKLAHYRRIPALRAVVIVSHAERRLEVWRRGDDGAWAVASAGDGERALLEAIGCELAVADVYRDELTGGSLV